MRLVVGLEGKLVLSEPAVSEVVVDKVSVEKLVDNESVAVNPVIELSIRVSIVLIVPFESSVLKEEPKIVLDATGAEVDGPGDTGSIAVRLLLNPMVLLATVSPRAPIEQMPTASQANTSPLG